MWENNNQKHCEYGHFSRNGYVFTFYHIKDISKKAIPGKSGAKQI